MLEHCFLDLRNLRGIDVNRAIVDHRQTLQRPLRKDEIVAHGRTFLPSKNGDQRRIDDAPGNLKLQTIAEFQAKIALGLIGNG